MDKISRKEAIQQDLKFYFTGKSCKLGHICEKYVSNRNCVECLDNSTEKYRNKNPERVRESTRQSMSKWRAKNPGKNYENVKMWCKKYPAKKLALNAKRRSFKLQRTPKWANFNKITEFYIEAEYKTKSTGIKYEVDHIIPLRGKLVSGLHTQDNLQVLTKIENCVKSNQLVGF